MWRCARSPLEESPVSGSIEPTPPPARQISTTASASAVALTAMADRLPDDAVASALASLQWTRQGDELVKVVTKKDFAEAMTFVNAVAGAAEAANHHPDIAISWNKVTLRVTTHDARSEERRVGKE